MKTLQQLFVLALILLVSVQTSQAFYEKSSVVSTFNEPQDFVDKVLGSSRIWVIEFFAPWCPHCQSFTPEFAKAAQNLKNIIHFAAVDCNEEKAKPLCGNFQVKGLPTILLFKPDLEKVTVEGKEAFTKKPVVYEGDRKGAPLANWALSFLPDQVIKVTSKNIDAILKVSETNPRLSNLQHTALFFSNKEKPSNFLKSLSLEFSLLVNNNKWLPIGQVQHTETALVEKYEITKFPSLVVVSKSGEVKRYEGAYDFENLYKYLDASTYVPTPEDKSGGPPPQKAPPPPPARKHELHHVDTKEEYEKACGRIGLCLVAFLDPSSENHKKEIKVLNDLVAKYKSLNTMWVSGPRHPTFVSGFPIADGFPQAAIFHRTKLKVKVLRSAFVFELMDEFVEGTLSGRGRTMVMDSEPVFDEAVEAPKETVEEEKVEKEDL